jgi:hypothetical protein
MLLVMMIKARERMEHQGNRVFECSMQDAGHDVAGEGETACSSRRDCMLIEARAV